MSVYDFNPDVCLQVLHEITEEIPSGVSGKNLKVVSPKIKFCQELLSFMTNSITGLTKKDIDYIWTNNGIPDKLKYLEELEKKSPKSDAWRPTTGNCNINSIIAKNLLESKETLKREIELVREESAMITPYLTAFSEQMREQLEEINSLEQKL